MESNRTFVVAVACTLQLALVACGGSSDSAIVPAGTHYGYVVSKTTAVPATGHQPTELGLDLGSKTSSTPDGKPDNQLGQALVGLKSVFDVQTAITNSVNNGTITLLIDFQTKDFVNTGNAGLAIRFGTNPMPAACTNPADNTTCGNQLKGNATFSLAADSPTDAALGGKITNGTFTSNAGDLALQIVIGTSTTPLVLNLVHARAKATGISETGIVSANLGGLLTLDDLKTTVGPALLAQVTAVLAASCTPPGPPPGCGCTGTAAIGILLADGDTGTAPNCQITVDELLAHPLVKTALQADSCSKDSCTAPDALSVGLQIEAVKATFPM
jgi:hypothetical protein